MRHKYAITAGIQKLPDNSPVVLRGDFELTAQTAKEAGFDGIELHLMNPGTIHGEKIKAIADCNGLEITGIATGMEYTQNHFSLINTDYDKRMAAIQRLKEHVDLAQTLDCNVIIGILRGNIPDFQRYDEFEGFLTDGLRQLARYAAAGNVQIWFESITRYINNYLCTVNETYDYIQRLGEQNISLHVDTHSMNIEDADMVGSIRYAGDRIDYVHFSDSNRLRPGLGHINFKQILKTLDEIGYTGYITVECLPVPDSKTCAFETMAYLKKLERECEEDRDKE